MNDWRDELAAARRAPTPAQATWDSHWRRWLDIALRSGRTPNDAIPIAWTRTEAQYGKRPKMQPEETQA